MSLGSWLLLVMVLYHKYAEGMDQTRIIGHSDNIYTFPYFCAFLLKDYLKEVGVNVYTES